jgi:hypothetical protein
MKTFLLFAILFCSSIEKHGVYICTGPNAYAYHKTKTCRGLRHCTGEIKEISLAQAKKDNRKACKLCYKKKQI